MTRGESNSSIDVRYVANLARIALSDEETCLYQEQLVEVITYVQTLAELDIEGVAPTAHPRPASNVFREDEPGESQEPDETMRNAPRAADGLLILPRIIE